MKLKSSNQYMSLVSQTLNRMLFNMFLIGAIFANVQSINAQENIDQENVPVWGGGSMNILTSNGVGQVFTPSCSNLSRVDVDLIYQGGTGSITATIFRDGSPIYGAQAKTYISESGLVQLYLDSVVTTTPGETLYIQLESDTYPLPLWKYADDTYPFGMRIFFGLPQDGDFFFRTYSTSCPQSNYGFVNLDTTNGSIPSNYDCQVDDHLGRLIVDGINNHLYICTQSGWIVK